MSSARDKADKDLDKESIEKSAVAETLDSIAPATESLRERIGTGLGAIMRSAPVKEGRPPSLTGKPKRPVPGNDILQV